MMFFFDPFGILLVGGSFIVIVVMFLRGGPSYQVEHAKKKLDTKNMKQFGMTTDELENAEAEKRRNWFADYEREKAEAEKLRKDEEAS